MSSDYKIQNHGAWRQRTNIWEARPSQSDVEEGQILVAEACKISCSVYKESRLGLNRYMLQAIYIPSNWGGLSFLCYLLNRARRACLNSSLDIGDSDLGLLTSQGGADGDEVSADSLPRNVPHISQASAAKMLSYVQLWHLQTSGSDCSSWIREGFGIRCESLLLDPTTPLP